MFDDAFVQGPMSMGNIIKDEVVFKLSMHGQTHADYSKGRIAPTTAPAMATTIAFHCNDGTPETYPSGGPKAPPFPVAPGLGAPPGASPPPLTLVGAVGRGPVDVGFVVVAFELLVELPVLFPLAAGELAVRVEVMLKVAVKGAVWRFWSRETPVESEVKTVTTGDAVVVALPVLLF